MALNLELKIKIASIEHIIEKIMNKEGKFISTLNQADSYFSFKKGLLKLRSQNGENQLIKYSRNESGEDRWSDYSILKLDGENILEYLKDLFEFETEVKKERKLYIYRNTRIHIDKVYSLGNFLELETVVNSITLDEAKEEFNKVVEFLELNTDNQIRKSYRDLMLIR